MSDNEKFANNPFARLASPLSAKGKTDPAAKTVGKGSANVQRLPSPKVIADSVEEGDDAFLFLQAVQSVQPKNKGKRAAQSDFALAERVDLPKVEKKISPKQALAAEKNAIAPTEETEVDSPVMSSAEDDAFFKAMREVTALPGKGREVPPAVEPTAPPAQANNILQDFLDGKLEFALSLTGEYLEGYVVGLDELTMNKLRAGQYSPEAHLDLHGLNAVQAYQALLGFFRGSWYKGLRSVLVVPGRGRNSTDGFSILRDKLQLWLTQEPFKRVVLAFCTARPVDGGPGSVYVLLRKYRKKGKIYWERMPADPDLF